MRSAENPFAGQGPVLLDVGGEVGALLVTMPASLEGVEIEIRPQPASPEADPSDHPSSAAHGTTAHAPGHSHDHNHEDQVHLTHVEVLPRPTPSGVVHCAVFADLAQGCYELSERPFGQVALEVAVIGGQVTQASWPVP